MPSIHLNIQPEFFEAANIPLRGLRLELLDPKRRRDAYELLRDVSPTPNTPIE